ncbi:MAG TPA: ATP-binding protein, partial [Pseudonocardiaceae bacterium]|nr:ATP-binding protein [Pseudonocardiaceae bacterium]
ANLVELILVRDARALRLVIRDDGHGFDLPRDLSVLRADHHYGILGMQERARTIDGTLRVNSTPGRGTRIEVSVPLDPAPAVQ